MRTTRRLLTAGLIALLAPALHGTAQAGSFPDTIALPDGWLPEGIATGAGTSIYSGSRADGSIWAGDLRTGEGEVLVDAEDRFAVGIKVDRGLVFVAGGPTGEAYVYDADTGEEVAVLSLTAPGTFINDVTVTRDAAYFTDSFGTAIYRVALGPAGVPTGEVEAIELGGEWEQVEGFNANGIAASPSGSTLLVINSTSGVLYAVDPDSGEARAVDTGGAELTAGDGILLRGPTLYVVRNQLEQIVELRLAPDYRSASLVDTLSDPAFDVPTTIAAHGSSLYAVNARFNTTPTPDTEYDIVLVDGE